MRGEAEVFLGDIASAQENTEQAIVHYKQVVFGSEEGPITEDYNFIDYAVFEREPPRHQRLKRHIRQQKSSTKNM